MKYKEYKIYCEQDKLETLEAQLAALGIEEIIINDPADAELFSPEKAIGWFWNAVDESVLAQFRERPSVCFYLEAENSEDPSDPREERGASGIARERLSADQLRRRDWGLAQLLKSYEASVSTVDDQDWLHKWEEYFVPARVSQSIVVKPVWHAYEASEGERVIEIDPGMAFGTGTHATTAMCVRLLEKYVKPGCSVLDVGCGSGILSVAAAKLGASDVMAVDLDPLVVESTERNVALNGCAGAVAVREGDLTKGLDYRADVVAANLMADLVILLSKDVARHCAPEAVFISSGILDEKEKEVSSAVEEAGFDILEVLHEDGWCAIAGRYKGR